MLFTLELRNVGVHHRLQNDGAWRNCTEGFDLSPSDFRCGKPEFHEGGHSPHQGEDREFQRIGAMNNDMERNQTI